MNAAGPLIARECDVFCRYLTGRQPSQYVQAKYSAGLSTLPRADGATLVDSWLLGVARMGPWATSLADAYAALFRRFGPLRARLVLMLAIAENDAGLHGGFDSAAAGNRMMTLGALVAAGGWWAVRSLAALVLFAPVHAASALARSREPRG